MIRSLENISPMQGTVSVRTAHIPIPPIPTASTISASVQVTEGGPGTADADFWLHRPSGRWGKSTRIEFWFIEAGEGLWRGRVAYFNLAEYKFLNLVHWWRQSAVQHRMHPHRRELTNHRSARQLIIGPMPFSCVLQFYTSVSYGSSFFFSCPICSTFHSSIPTVPASVMLTPSYPLCPIRWDWARTWDSSTLTSLDQSQELALSCFTSLRLVSTSEPITMSFDIFWRDLLVPTLCYTYVCMRWMHFLMPPVLRRREKIAPDVLWCMH